MLFELGTLLPGEIVQIDLDFLIWILEPKFSLIKSGAQTVGKTAKNVDPTQGRM